MIIEEIQPCLLYSQVEPNCCKFTFIFQSRMLAVRVYYKGLTKKSLVPVGYITTVPLNAVIKAK